MSRRASDLDLAIAAPNATSSEWADICDALENAPLIYELDLVRPERVTSERLKEKIQREGIAIYPEDKNKSANQRRWRGQFAQI